MKPRLHLTHAAGIAAALLFTAPPSLAQIDWISFQEDPSRLSVASGLGSGDTQEKDYAWGDLDKDGWTDLVIVRKQPFTTSGRRANVLLMNEDGVLTDRTALYASASDVGGDNGFLTPTNDRDVIIVDVDNDGWDDVVTATTLTPNQTKAVSHPRIYMNLGNDGGGNWLGLRFEADRTPQIKVNGNDYFPFFCGVGAGDVTGDGFADLYFADYDVAGFQDVNDRLFVNDGTGKFSDESSRLSTAMLKSPFGTSADIADMNQDGVNDVVKNTGLGQTSGNPLVAISYNNPGNEGFFNLLDQPYQGTPYHVSVGDLNQDGKLDMIMSDDAADRYMLNQGNDGLGRVNWSAAFTFQVNDDGFGSNNIIVDLDDDGWSDAIICDVDVDIPGCNRRMHIYHNLGGNVGGNITMKEESGNGFKGVTGLTGNAQVGTHDVAVFDIDNDGDKDLVVGRCSGTEVYMNLLIDGGGDDIGTRYCDPSVINSSGLPGLMNVQGSDVASDNDVTLLASQLPNNKFGYFLTSETQGFVPNPGGSQGNLCLGGTIGRYVKDILNSGGSGTFQLTIDTTQLPPPLNTAIQAGETWNFTTWYRDVNPTQTSNFTDAISVLFQ